MSKNFDPSLTITKIPFYFSRHGQTDWNAQSLCQGQKDIPLNEKGREEAFEIGKLLSPIPFQSICFSPLLRAKETALIIASFFPESKVSSIPELMERSWGKWEGKSNHFMYKQEEEELASEYTHSSSVDPLFERHDQFLLRVARGINLALLNRPPILIVSHGRVFHALCQLLKVNILKQISHVQPILCKPNLHNWEIKNL